jgi:hypothetical protein
MASQQWEGMWESQAMCVCVCLCICVCVWWRSLLCS